MVLVAIKRPLRRRSHSAPTPWPRLRRHRGADASTRHGPAAWSRRRRGAVAPSASWNFSRRSGWFRRAGLLHKNKLPNLNIILMSATLDLTRYTSFLKGPDRHEAVNLVIVDSEQCPTNAPVQRGNFNQCQSWRSRDDAAGRSRRRRGAVATTPRVCRDDPAGNRAVASASRDLMSGLVLL